MTTKELRYDDLGITTSDLMELMGLEEEACDAAFMHELDSILSEVKAFLRPRFSFFAVKDRPDFEMGHIIERQLRKAEAYAMFICTAGVEYQEYQDRLMSEGDMVRVFIADSLGSVIAEKTADKMEQTLQKQIDKLGWKHTNRFSPGYCGWHVRQQQLLFPKFGGETNGVRLTDSSLMIPIKSVSGIIGLGKEVRHLDYTCGLCNFEKCYKRRKRSDKTVLNI